MRKLFLLALLASSAAQGQAYVHWLDTHATQKPKPVNVNQPNPATAPIYWVSLSGSGTTCSQASPCNMDGVLGKPGTTGGPAIIRVKGSGSHSWFSDTIFGSGDFDCTAVACPNWILITTWPAGSTGCATECTATFSGNSNMNSSNVHHIMWDGGPDMKIRFNSNGGSGTYAHNINSDWHLVYRTQQFCSSSQTLGWQVGATTSADNIWFINNEFYGCASTGDQSSAIYFGPGSGGGYSNVTIKNNIIRDFYGECIEVNPRITSSNMVIIGNLIHDCGVGTCNNPSTWNCRPAIVMGTQSGSGNAGTIIQNNVMYNTGSGCIWDRGGSGGGAAPRFEYNTCYNYGIGNGPPDDDPNPYGITNISGGGSSASIKNNIFYSSTGVNPLGSPYANASNNACPSGETCGSSSQVWTTGNWLSTSSASRNFLIPTPTAVSRNTGASLPLSIPDYTGKTRPIGAGYDIGAMEQGTGTSTPPAAPTP